MTISYSKPVFAPASGAHITTAFADGVAVAQVAKKTGQYAVRMVEGHDAGAWHTGNRLFAIEFVRAAAETL